MKTCIRCKVTMSKKWRQNMCQNCLEELLKERSPKNQQEKNV